MLSPMKPGEQRIFFRRVVNRMAKIQIGADTRDCLGVDMCDSMSSLTFPASLC